VQTDVPPATTRSDILGINSDRCVAEKQPIRCDSQTRLRYGQTAQVSALHPSLQRHMQRMPGRLERPQDLPPRW